MAKKYQNSGLMITKFGENTGSRAIDFVDLWKDMFLNNETITKRYRHYCQSSLAEW